MTTRQFLSILLSCILFVHPLTPWQWLGTIIVFGTLYYKAFAKKHESKESTNANDASPVKQQEDGTKEEMMPVLNAKDEHEKKDGIETA